MHSNRNNPIAADESDAGMDYKEFVTLERTIDRGYRHFFKKRGISVGQFQRPFKSKKAAVADSQNQT